MTCKDIIGGFGDYKFPFKLYLPKNADKPLPAFIYVAHENVENNMKFDENGVRITVQGVVDCVYRDPNNGRLILIDYKTDRISKEEELNREALIRRMAEHHGSQLNCYAKAVEHLFGKAPDEIYVYSLPLGELIPFTP